MASRTEISTEQKSILKRFFDSGMTSLKEQQKIKDCAEETGLDVRIIQNYIGNTKRKTRKPEMPEAKKRLKQLQGPNGYSYFVGKVPRGAMGQGEYMKYCSQKWRDMSQVEKDEYLKEAKARRDNPELGRSREELITFHTKAIFRSVEALEKLAVEIGGVIVDPKENSPPCIFGSNNSFHYFKDISSQYELKVRGGDFFGKDSKKEKLQLKTDVRKLFNDLWAKACGKPERVPYLALKSREAKITVSGLPVGTDFKDPSDYSKTQLLEILKNAKNITLKIERMYQRKNVATTTTSTSSELSNPPAGGLNEGHLRNKKELQEDVTGFEEADTPAPSTSLSTELQEDVTAFEEAGTPAQEGTIPMFSEEMTSTEAAEVVEDIVNQIAQKPGLLHEVMTAEGDALNKVIELKQELKEESGCSGKPGKRKRKGAKLLTQKKKAKTGSQTFIFETIKEMKEINGHRFYLIKWVGYKDETWEPEGNIRKEHIVGMASIKVWMSVNLDKIPPLTMV